MNPVRTCAILSTSTSSAFLSSPARLPSPRQSCLCFPDASPRVVQQAPCMLAKRRKPSQRPAQDGEPAPSSNASGPSSDRQPLSSPPSSQPPARVNVDSSTLSLRQQLALVKNSNQFSDDDKPVIRTSFRKKKDAYKKRSRYTDADIPDGKYSYTSDPIIYVDGYNVIGMWPKLRKWRDRSDLETARRLLLEAVAEFSAVREWECVVVFDAQNTDSKQRCDNYDNTDVRVVYTANETADSYIERSIFECCKWGERQVWAATSDMLHARVSGAMGAHVMSASLFVQELKRSQKETSEKVEELENDGSVHRSRMLMSIIDKDTLQQLYDLRDELGRT